MMISAHVGKNFGALGENLTLAHEPPKRPGSFRFSFDQPNRDDSGQSAKRFFRSLLIRGSGVGLSQEPGDLRTEQMPPNISPTAALRSLVWGKAEASRTQQFSARGQLKKTTRSGTLHPKVSIPVASKLQARHPFSCSAVALQAQKMHSIFWNLSSHGARRA